MRDGAGSRGSMQVGVLALQGDFALHASLLESMGVAASYIKTAEGLDQIDALVIPGGESTTIGMLMERFGMVQAIRRRVEEGMRILGTCAGAILMAREIEGSDQTRLGVIPMTVARNAYGRQIESFEVAISDLAPELAGAEQLLREGAPPAIAGVFIRAPVITATDPGVTVLARYEGDPVVVAYNGHVAATFHPELARDAGLHRYFLQGASRGERFSTASSDCSRSDR